VQCANGSSHLSRAVTARRRGPAQGCRQRHRRSPRFALDTPVIEPSATGISAEAAKALLGFRFNESAVARINQLAEKNRQGTLTPSERAVLARCQRVGTFLNLIHAKARRALSEATSPAS
jgi:hypothetical protein